MSETTARALVEHDFFGIEHGGPAKRPTAVERKKSFREIHGEISRMSPDVIKSVIATSSAAARKTTTSGSAAVTPLPVLNPTSRSSKVETTPAAVDRLTIFYKGAVVAFDLPQEEAEKFLKLVEAEIVVKVVDASEEPVLEKDGDLPMARRISLQRFLEKRQERMIFST